MVRIIKQGEYTSTIYKLIADGDFKEASQILESEVKKSGVETRAALSLIASCKYQLEEFEAAASYFTKLIQITQDNDDYKFSLAMCYYKSCDYSSAMKATYAVSSPAYEERILQLQSAIKYMEEDLPASKSLIEKQSQDNEEAVINKGCILYKEGLYPEAIEKFNQAVQLGGSKSHLSFNIALCYYELKEYALSLKYIADIIERGIKEHPELSVGLTTEGIDVRSVGNTRVLHETALIEAFNLKAAIEYQLNNIEAAAEAMTDMPPRSEDELDSVTLHNSALVNMANAPTEGFEKLQYLLSTGSAPPVTFSNLIILYLKYEYFSLAADTMAENQELAAKFMDPYLFNFVESLIMLDSSPEEAYRRLDVMASKHTELLRKLTKQVQEARNDQDEDKVKAFVNQYDEEIERFIPILMQQAKIYWDKENYNQVEKIFRKSVEFCNDHDVWKLNVAHVLFMQVPTEGENSAQSSHKFKEAAGFYEPIVKRNYESILNVEAVVLANLCVSYIMTSQNEEAEELMRRIEKEEETLAYEYPERKVYHLCIVNLVIGTLYCSKGNFEFGITRVIKSLEPFQKKLGVDTWFYVKRCFLSLLESLSKHLIMIPDNVLYECLDFLDYCELYGKEIKARDVDPLRNGSFIPHLQRKETQSLFSTNIRLGRVYMSKNFSTERKRGYNQMSEPMEFENQVRVSAVGAKHSRRTALGEISKNKPKSSFASIKPALKSSKTSAGRVNVFQDKKSFVPDSLSSIESSPTQPSKRVVVPDLDCDLKDIFVVPEYAAEIDSHLREAELRTRPKPNYMRKQNDLTPQMRSILIDWLVEVAVEYKLNDETLYLAVNYVDRFLSQMAVLRGKLQLVGTAAMLLASKFEEIWAPEVTEFVYITDETYTRQQVLRMEHLMIKVLKFDICCVTPLSFINRLLKASQADEQTCKFARFLCDLTLLEYSIVKFCPSLVATAVVLQANYVVRGTGWSDTLEHYSGYSYEAVKPVIDEIQTLHQSSLSWSHKTVYQKHEGVSTISPRSGNPPRQSTSTVDNDDMNMSVDSL